MFITDEIRTLIKFLKKIRESPISDDSSCAVLGWSYAASEVQEEPACDKYLTWGRDSKQS